MASTAATAGKAPKKASLPPSTDDCDPSSHEGDSSSVVSKTVSGKIGDDKPPGPRPVSGSNDADSGVGDMRLSCTKSFISSTDVRKIQEDVSLHLDHVRKSQDGEPSSSGDVLASCKDVLELLLDQGAPESTNLRHRVIEQKIIDTVEKFKKGKLANVEHSQKNLDDSFGENSYDEVILIKGKKLTDSFLETWRNLEIQGHMSDQESQGHVSAQESQGGVSDPENQGHLSHQISRGQSPDPENHGLSPNQASYIASPKGIGQNICRSQVIPVCYVECDGDDAPPECVDGPETAPKSEVDVTGSMKKVGPASSGDAAAGSETSQLDQHSDLTGTSSNRARPRSREVSHRRCKRSRVGPIKFNNKPGKVLYPYVSRVNERYDKWLTWWKNGPQPPLRETPKRRPRLVWLKAITHQSKMIGSPKKKRNDTTFIGCTIRDGEFLVYSDWYPPSLISLPISQLRLAGRELVNRDQASGVTVTNFVCHPSTNQPSSLLTSQSVTMHSTDSISEQVNDHHPNDRIRRAVINSNAGNFQPLLSVPIPTSRTDGVRYRLDEGAPVNGMPRMVEDRDGDAYDMTSKPLGFAILIVNREFTDRSTRYGAEFDKYYCIRLALRLGYEPVVFENQTAANMLAIMEKYGAMDHTNRCSVSVFISSHGSRGYVNGTDAPVRILDVLAPFSRCHTLDRKPKNLFIQACQSAATAGDRHLHRLAIPERERGTDTEGHAHNQALQNRAVGGLPHTTMDDYEIRELLVDTDGNVPPDDPDGEDIDLREHPDCYVALATFDDKAWRCLEYGSVFVAILHKRLIRYSPDYDLDTIIKAGLVPDVREFTRSLGIQTPSVISTLSKRVRFQPRNLCATEYSVEYITINQQEIKCEKYYTAGETPD